MRNKIKYYDVEAEEVDIFGNLREICFSDQILRTISNHSEKVIDIGCGDGYNLYRLLDCRNTVTAYGADISKKRLQKTATKVKTASLTQASIFSLPFKDNSFDTVICSELLEHLQNYQKAIKELARIAKRQIIITVPNEEKLFIDTCPNCRHRFYSNDHVNSFNANELKKTIETQNTNLKINKMRKFHTIYSYNKVTAKWPKCLRIGLDGTISLLSEIIPFFKPNYLLISIKKKKQIRFDFGQ